MRTATVTLLLLAGLVGATRASADEERILVGTYTTDKLPEPGAVQAVFTPAPDDAAEESWSVVFTVFDMVDYTYTGTAWGSLDEGGLSGEVVSETGEQTFTFSGEHVNGRFNATHAEITDDFQVPTGEMTLAEATVLSGTYRLPEEEDEPEPIRALFVPREARTETDGSDWDVLFHFTFGSREYSYLGRAEGGLSEGPLAGRVENEAGNRIFIFSGRHDGSTYRATHFEITSGEEEATGTMVLRR